MRYHDAIALRQALTDRLLRQYPDQAVGRLQKRAVMARFMPFPIDVGVGDADHGPADVLRGGIDLGFAGLAILEVPAVSVHVHVAEKLHALSFPRTDGRENSRVKDLVDVVLLRELALADIAAIRTAAEATFARRATHALPKRIVVPEHSWAAEYRKLAKDVGLAADVATVARAGAWLDHLVERIHQHSSS